MKWPGGKKRKSILDGARAIVALPLEHNDLGLNMNLAEQREISEALLLAEQILKNTPDGEYWIWKYSQAPKEGE